MFGGRWDEWAHLGPESEAIKSWKVSFALLEE